MKKFLIPLALISTLSMAAPADYWPEATRYSQGDLVTLPNKSGDYIALIYQGAAIYWNPKAHWFTPEPIRNYQSVSIPLYRGIPDGDYYLYEIDAKPVLQPQSENASFPSWGVDVQDPSKWENWASVRGFPIHIECKLNLIWC